MSLALAYTQLQPMKKLRSMSLASVPSCKAVLSAVVDTPGWLCKGLIPAQCSRQRLVLTAMKQQIFILASNAV